MDKMKIFTDVEMDNMDKVVVGSSRVNDSLLIAADNVFNLQYILKMKAQMAYNDYLTKAEMNKKMTFGSLGGISTIFSDSYLWNPTSR